jgi:hypothetical protein
VAAPAPTNNYGFDVHTESGFLEVDPASLFQEWVLSPVWMALVWIVHALIVALEWCYTLDLLHSAAMANVARALQGLQGRVTSPWLAAMLALASIAAAYHGLVRRRVAQTLGDALLMLAMMAGGLWVIADPVNTVGALGQLSNEASLGAFGVTVSGTPNRQSSPLAMGMAELFTTEVEGPWCYLEFGNVEWCRDPRQLDTRLRDAALGLAQADQARSDCSPEVGPTTLCVMPGAQQARALHLSALLLRRARTNGELFLALPADSAERNSVQQGTALLHVLCGASEANACRGPTAPQAEFRTSSGTLARVEGLVLISAGGLGMVLLIGFIVLRLLEAALVTLLYLLLAPLAVLAPALGDAPARRDRLKARLLALPGGRAAGGARDLAIEFTRLVDPMAAGVNAVVGRLPSPPHARDAGPPTHRDACSPPAPARPFAGPKRVASDRQGSSCRAPTQA